MGRLHPPAQAAFVSPHLADLFITDELDLRPARTIDRDAQWAALDALLGPWGHASHKEGRPLSLARSGRDLSGASLPSLRRTGSRRCAGR
jgi:hypothetical protein